jgi:hypothetical protein
MVSVTPRPRFAPGERNPGTHWTGGWVDPRAGLDTEARGEIPFPLLEMVPRLLKYYEISHYAIFLTSYLLSIRSSPLSKAICSYTSSVYVLPFGGEINFIPLHMST